MPQWSGDELSAKRELAIDALKKSMSGVLTHKDWIQLTEIAWQSMADKVIDAQLDVLRAERFEGRKSPSDAKGRMHRYERFKNVLKALNFLFKCYEVDWSEFLRTIVELVEGRADGAGLGGPARGDQQACAEAASGEGSDDSGSC
jgi:hypothetical protein